MTKRWIFLLIAAGLISCGQKEPVHQDAKASMKPLRIARAEKEMRVLEVAGTVRAADVADLASRYGGFVQDIKVRAGDRVRKGDLLVLLDDRGLQAQVDKVQSATLEVKQAIEEAKNHLESARAQKDLAASTFERMKALYEKKSASLQEYEEALGRKESTEATWQATSRKLAQAESKLQQVESDSINASANLSYQRISAPFDGVITSVPSDKGTFVNPGQVLVSIEDPSKYQFLFSVEQDFVPPVSEKAQVLVSKFKETVQADIAEVSPSADSKTRTYLVKANLISRSGLQSGQSGIIRLKIASEGGIWIPVDFLRTLSDVETVMVKQGEGWRKVLVKSGSRREGKVEILSGISEGEEIGLFKEL